MPLDYLNVSLCSELKNGLKMLSFAPNDLSTLTLLFLKILKFLQAQTNIISAAKTMYCYTYLPVFLCLF